MELKQARGDTWYLEDWQIIPLYKVDERHCVLLDTGHYHQRQDIEGALADAGLTPVGIIGSHAHNDHASNHHYFQQKYHLPVVLSMGEAALCCSMANMKAYFFMDTISSLERNEWVNHMLVRADRIILPEEERCVLAGAEFGILHLPGHSPDHIAVRTPDDVVYLADALLTGEELERTRLPYHFCHRQAIASLEELKSMQATQFIAAHRGILDDLGDLPQRNIDHLRSIARQMLGLLEEPVHLSALTERACRTFRLTSTQPGPVAMYERNVRAFLEYLLDEDLVETSVRGGVFHYQTKL